MRSLLYCVPAPLNAALCASEEICHRKIGTEMKIGMKL